MTDQTPTNPEGPAGMPAVVEADRACMRCGYNLRSLPTDGKCPECGLPVADSVWRYRIRYADPAWVEKVTLGVQVSIAAVIFMCLLCMCSCIIGMLDSVLLVQLLVVALYLTFAAGAWLITWPEPGRVEGLWPWWVIRAAFITGAMGLLIAIVGAPENLLVESEWPARIAWWLAGGSVMIVLTGILVQVRRLAGRIPDQDLARRARVTMWILLGWVAMDVFLARILLNAALILVLATFVILPLLYVGALEGLSRALRSEMLRARHEAEKSASGGQEQRASVGVQNQTGDAGV